MGFNKLNTLFVFEDQEYNILLNIALFYGRHSIPNRSERNVCKLSAECILILQFSLEIFQYSVRVTYLANRISAKINVQVDVSGVPIFSCRKKKITNLE